jgi:hypothetical protein
VVMVVVVFVDADFISDRSNTSPWEHLNSSSTCQAASSISSKSTPVSKSNTQSPNQSAL